MCPIHIWTQFSFPIPLSNKSQAISTAQSRRTIDHDHNAWQHLNATLSKLVVSPAVHCQAVEDAINAGIDRFSFDDRDRVKMSQKELRISDTLAKETLDMVSRKAFTGFITRSRSQRDRLEAAKELKKLVFFSNIVVAPLLEDVQVRLVGREAARLQCRHSLSEANQSSKSQ